MIANDLITCDEALLVLDLTLFGSMHVDDMLEHPSVVADSQHTIGILYEYYSLDCSSTVKTTAEICVFSNMNNL